MEGVIVSRVIVRRYEVKAQAIQSWAIYVRESGRRCMWVSGSLSLFEVEVGRSTRPSESDRVLWGEL